MRITLLSLAASVASVTALMHSHHRQRFTEMQDKEVEKRDVETQQVTVYATQFVTNVVTMTGPAPTDTSSATTSSEGNVIGNVVGDNELAVAYSAVASSSTLATLASSAMNTFVTSVSTSVPATTSSATSTSSAPFTSETLPSTTATSAAPSSASSSSGKRGLAWAPSSSSTAALFNSASGAVSWYFNWGTTSSASALPDLEFIPEQWGSSALSALSTSLAVLTKSGNVVLGFNEPDNSGQSTMTASQAAAYYKQYLTPLRKSGVIGSLGSPGVSNAGSPGGLTWLSDFMTQCGDCEIDFIQLHWYGPSISDFESHLSTAYSNWNLPIWLTEFACTQWDAATNPTTSEIESFMSSALAFLDETSYIAKYAWFGAMSITDTSLGAGNMLVTSDGGSLSDLGKIYMGL